MKIPDNILFFRHGESLHNVHPEAWSFHNDDVLGLTMDGAKQAFCAGLNLAGSRKNFNPHHYEVWCSPQVRAVQTAGVLVNSYARERRILAKTPNFCPELQEFFCNQSGEAAVDFDFDTFLQEPHRRYALGSVAQPELRRTLSVLDLLYNANEFYTRIGLANDQWASHWSTDRGRLEHFVVSHHFTIAAMLTYALLCQDRVATWYITSGRYLVDDVTSEEFIWWTDLCRLIVKLPIEHCVPYSTYNFFGGLQNGELFSSIRKFIAK